MGTAPKSHLEGMSSGREGPCCGSDGGGPAVDHLSPSGDVRNPLVCCLAQLGRSTDPHTHVPCFCTSGKAEPCHWFCQEIL